MFKELLPLLSKRSLVLTAAKISDDQLRVTITPRPTGKDDPKELSQPFAVEGTAEELDAELPGAIVSYAAQHMTLEKSLAEVKANMEQALKEVKDEAAKKVAEAKKTNKVGSTSKPAAKVEPKPEPKKETEPPSLFAAMADPTPASAPVTETPAAPAAEPTSAVEEDDDENDDEEPTSTAAAAAPAPAVAAASAQDDEETSSFKQQYSDDEVLNDMFPDLGQPIAA